MSRLANNYLKLLLEADAADDHKIILMGSGFVFNRVTHSAYSDVSGSELTTQFGYTAGGATLANAAVSQDDTNNAGVIGWDTVSWNVSGGSLTASGAIIYNDTADPKHVVGYITFGGNQTTLDGGIASITNPSVRLLG